MGMPEYRQVIEAFCRKAAIGNVADILNHGAITIHGVPVWLQYFEPSDLCRVVVDLGAPEAGNPAAIWRMMLESNCTSNSRYLPFLGMNPLDGHAILILHLSVSTLQQETDLPKLLEEQLSPVVKSWAKALNQDFSVSSADHLSDSSHFV
jgi:hypothetical protein